MSFIPRISRFLRQHVWMRLFLTHVLSAALGLSIGWTLRPDASASRDLVMRTFFLQAVRLQAQNGSLLQLQKSVAHYQETSKREGRATFQTNLGLLEAFALLARNEQAAGNRAQADAALERARYYCSAAGLTKCSHDDIATRFAMDRPPREGQQR
jgi:hypothetical protein